MIWMLGFASLLPWIWMLCYWHSYDLDAGVLHYFLDFNLMMVFDARSMI
jgi:hypothetical protein